MKLFRWLSLFRLSAPLIAVFLLTGAIEVSCSGDPADDNGGGTPGSSRPNSHAIGQWSPVAGVDTCTQAEHDAYFVVGPDGKKYPTWHPPTFTRSDSTVCSFGHEHGVNPSGVGPFYTEIRRHFAFDANANGTINQDELDVSGIPFGYVAEQLDGYNATVGTGIAGQRHQSHAAYKIAIASFADRDRVVANVVTTNYVNCAHLVALNQETTTADAFASNLHEAIVALDCTGAASSPYPVRLIASGMMSFGNRGAFDAAALPSATAQPINVTGALPITQPAGVTGVRRAIGAVTSSASRLTDNAFVVAGATVVNLQNAIGERWVSEFSLTNGGATIATVRPVVTALDPGRFYNAAANSRIGHTIDLCYSGLNAGGAFVNDPAQAVTIVRQVRGNNECTATGNEAARTSAPLANRIAFDATTSPFRNCIRRTEFGNISLNNSGGATTQYSDPFGRAMQVVRGATSNVKQYLAAINTAQLPAGSVDLQVVTFADTNTCATTVHLPN